MVYRPKGGYSAGIQDNVPRLEMQSPLVRRLGHARIITRQFSADHHEVRSMQAARPLFLLSQTEEDPFGLAFWPVFRATGRSLRWNGLMMLTCLAHNLGRGPRVVPSTLSRGLCPTSTAYWLTHGLQSQLRDEPPRRNGRPHILRRSQSSLCPGADAQRNCKISIGR